MIILFCCEPFNLNSVDQDYIEEYKTAKCNGFRTYLISYEDLVDDHNVNNAIKKVSKQETTQSAIYRGWMLTDTQYELLYEALLSKNVKLINSPHEYCYCHYLPNNYNLIKAQTPKSIWCSVDDFTNRYGQLRLRLDDFSGKSLFIKDYVKSRKHEWYEACFIKNSKDDAEIKRVVNNFIKRQDGFLNKGLVFREFVELEFLTTHAKSNMPLSKEFRLFILNKKLLSKYDYWDEGEYTEENILIDDYQDIIQNIESNFFTMDIAKAKDGRWIIIEIGDGQVSGLPYKADIEQFYRNV